MSSLNDGLPMECRMKNLGGTAKYAKYVKHGLTGVFRGFEGWLGPPSLGASARQAGLDIVDWQSGHKSEPHAKAAKGAKGGLVKAKMEDRGLRMDAKHLQEGGQIFLKIHDKT